MTLSEYRETISWQAAMEIGPQLLTLAEELPAAEELSLSLQLRQLAVEVPGALAADLVAGARPRLEPVLKLMTVLELVDQVYPAIEVADARRAAGELAERLNSDNYGEVPAPAPAAAPAEVDDEAEAAPDQTPAATPLTQADLDGTPLTMADAAAQREAAQASAKAPVSVSVTPEAASSEDTHVQPDSAQ